MVFEEIRGFLHLNTRPFTVEQASLKPRERESPWAKLRHAAPSAAAEGVRPEDLGTAGQELRIASCNEDHPTACWKFLVRPTS